MNNNWVKAILFCILVIFVIAFKYNILYEPYHWDAMGYVIDHSLDMYNNNFRLTGDYYIGHPPLQYLSLALTWKIFGYSLLVSHLYIIIIALIGLFYTFRLGEYLFNFEVGVGAVVLLFFNQLFFAQMGTLHHSIPLLTLGIISVYYYLKKRLFLFVLFATMLLLIKETASFVLLAIFIHFFVDRLIKNKKIRLKDIKNSWFIIIPLFPLLTWFLYLKIIIGWPFRTDVLHKSDFLYTLILNLFRNFFYDFTPDNVNKYNFIISIFLIISLVKIKTIRSKLVYCLFILIIILHITLFSSTADLPRYFTPILPFFYILGAYSVYLIFSKLKYMNYFYFVTIIICAGLFISNYTGTRAAPGWQLESNLEYLDMIKTHRSAVKYIETKFPNSTVITNWPMIKELSDEKYGYVSKKMKASNDYSLSEKDVVIYYSPQSEDPNFIRKFNKDNLILIKKFVKNNKYAEIYLLKMK